MNRVESRKKVGISSRRGACRGQGMLEYMLILAVIVGVTAGVMATVSVATGALINSVMTNIQAATNVTGN